jgi:hypothetical protein
MPIKEVNLSGTLNLQDDEYAIGLNGFVELVNLRQQNGKLVQRYGTGSPTTLSSKNIDNMEIFVDRRLQAVTIDSSSSNYTFSASAKTLTLSATTGVTIPGSTSKDWTTVFKAGDTIYINSIASDNDGIFTIASITSTVMTFENAPTNEGPISSGTITLGFAFADFNDTEPSHITAADANSFDGRAWITSYTNTNKFLSLVSPLDYTDNIDLEDFGTGSGDMFIRPRAYTDAVRIACGLEHSPRIFKYVNRHHFNGILKSVYNSHADLLYPRWVIDTATPVLPSDMVEVKEVTSNEELATYYSDHTPKNPKFILGSLNMVKNHYKWSFVPVYDGNQEGLLEEPIAELSSESFPSMTWERDIHGFNRITNQDMSIINEDTACMYSRIRFTINKINPRLSGVNVYRSTNGGTPYKIKSIYAGDNDVTQKTITTGYNQNDRVLWSGGSVIWNGSGSNATWDDLDAFAVMIDGREYEIANGTGWDNYRSTGYQSVELTEAVTTVGTPGNSFSVQDYGDIKRCKFNHISKDTDPISGGNDSYAGGSPNGGWYFANSTTTLNSTTPTITDQTGYDGGMANDSDNDFHEEGPFGDNASTGIDMRIANPGDSKNDAGVRFTLAASGDSNAAGDYVVSGWIRAKNLNSSSSSMNFYLNTTSASAANGPGSSGILSIATSSGSQNASFPWVYFQHTVTLGDSANLFGFVFINTPDDLTHVSDSYNAVHLWGVDMRAVVPGLEPTANLRGFMGENIIASSEIDAFNIPAGQMKGNRITNHDLFPYPAITNDNQENWNLISDNYGPFIKCVKEIGADDEQGGTERSDSYSLSTSGYQWIASGSPSSTDGHNGSTVDLEFIDTGLPDGARHPNETATSTDVKFKHATMLNGRQFVGNVKITSDEDIEEYPNFVMFSEANAPDIIPTTNFIQLQDLQGGEIVGIESLMSDIVVFMTNGIFRLSVPSNNPHNWSLVEAHKNVGALHDKGIVKTDNGIFFLSRSDIYFLDSGFSLKPISDPIRDTYQIQSTAEPNEMRLHHNIKENYLYVLYNSAIATNSTVFYVYDLNRGVWYQETHLSLDSTYKELGIDNLGNSILIESDTNSLVRKLHDTTEFRDKGSVGIRWLMKTGKQILNSLDMNALLRRVNTIVTHNASATDNDISITTDAGTTTKTDFLDGIQSSRISKRGKYIQIQIDSEANEDYQHEINHVDVEYE